MWIQILHVLCMYLCACKRVSTPKNQEIIPYIISLLFSLVISVVVWINCIVIENRIVQFKRFFILKRIKYDVE